MGDGNIQHPTPNIQHPIKAERGGAKSAELRREERFPLLLRDSQTESICEASPPVPQAPPHPGPMTRSLPLARPSRASAFGRIPIAVSQSAIVPHFMAERETESGRVFGDFTKFGALQHVDG